MEKNLTTGSVGRQLIGFSLPYLLSYLLQTLYGLSLIHSSAGKLLLKQNLGQRSKGCRQPIQPAAERLIAGQLLELAQMVCSDEIVDTLPRQ